MSFLFQLILILFLNYLDNGRSFGKQYYDEMSILAPIKQCCLFRYSTFRRLKYLYTAGFSKLIDESLKIDPLYPILTDDHLKAVDRRLEKILLEIHKCTEKFLPTHFFSLFLLFRFVLNNQKSLCKNLFFYFPIFC